MWIVMIKSFRYYIKLHKKLSHPDEIQNTFIIYEGNNI